MKKVYLVFYLVIIIQMGFSQTFFPENHPPIQLGQSIDLGVVFVNPFAQDVDFDENQNQWNMTLEVFNAINAEFLIGKNQYTFPNACEVDPQSTIGIIEPRVALTPSELWRNQFDFNLSATSSVVIPVIVDNRESIIFKSADKTFFDLFEPFVDLAVSQAFDRLYSYLNTTVTQNSNSNPQLSQIFKDGVANGFREALNSTNNTLNELSARAIVETIQVVLEDVIPNMVANNMNAIIRDRFGYPDISSLTINDINLLALTPEEINRLNNLTGADLANELGVFFFEKAIDFVLASSFETFAEKALGSSATNTIDHTIGWFNAFTGVIDNTFFPDYTICIPLRFADTRPEVENLNFAFEQSMLTWTGFDEEDDPLEYDVYLKSPGDTDFVKLNSSRLTQSFFQLNMTPVPGQEFEWFVTVHYPEALPIQIRDSYFPGIIIPDDCDNCIKSEVASFNTCGDIFAFPISGIDFSFLCFDNNEYGVFFETPAEMPSGLSFKIDDQIISELTPSTFYQFPTGGASPFIIGSNPIAELSSIDLPICREIQTISFFPSFNPVTNTSACASSNLFSINYTLPASGALAEYLVYDNQGNAPELLGPGDVFSEFYPSGTVVTLTIEDPNNDNCAQMSQTLTVDCGNPPVDDCAGVQISGGTINCNNETVAITITGDPTSSYIVTQAGGNQVLMLGGSTADISFVDNGSNTLNFSVREQTQAVDLICASINIDISACNTVTPADYCFYWPFEAGTVTNASPWLIVPGSGSHFGADLYAEDWNLNTGGDTDCGEPVYAPVSGTVWYAGDNGVSFGNQVVIQTLYPGVAVRLAHLETINVTTGPIEAGTLIGTVGKTGLVPTPDFTPFCHLHLAIYEGLDNAAWAELQTGAFLSDANLGTDLTFNCEDEFTLLSAATPGQCFAPGASLDVTFREMGTSQNAVIEFCPSNGGNCEVATGGSNYVLDNNINQNTWTLSTIAPTTPGDYNIKIYDPVNPAGTVAESTFAITISDDCGDVAGDCIAPTSLTATSTADGESVLFNWSPVNGATGYRLQARFSNTLPWAAQIDNFQGTSYTSGSAPCTGYDFQVAALCADGSLSPYAQVSLVTEGCNPGPTGPDGTGGGGGTGGEIVGDCPGDNEDDEDPVFINCPPQNYLFGIDNADECQAYVNWSVPVAVDNCNVTVTQTSGPQPGTLQDIGVYTIVYLAEDNNDNTETCSFSVRVEDGQELQFTNCPTTPLVFGSDPDFCGVYANWSIPVAVDNCEVTVSHQSGPQPGDQLAPGVYNVVYQAVNNGNPQEAATCSFFVQVNETQNPELNCPQDVFVGSDPGVCEAAVDNLQLEFAFDNCPYTVTWASSPTDVTGTGTSTSDNASGAIFPVGVTTVTYTITENDDNGNGIVVATCDLIVTVTDTEAPMITCPASVTIGTDHDTAGNYDCATDEEWTHPSPTDNCAVTVYTITYTNPDGSTEGPADLLGQEGMALTRNFALGVTTILYHVEDEEGNITECTWTVDVIDDEDPMIFCEEVVATNVYTFDGPLDLWPEDVVTATISVVPSMTITDLNIPLLAGTQADMGNLAVTLTSPAGTTVSIFDGLCGGTADFNMSLDDAAATNITTASCAPLGGGMSHISTEALAAFNGENSAGDWVLTFTNTSVDVCGYLTDWQLEIIGNDVGVDANRLQVIANKGTCSYTMFNTDFDPPFTDNCEGAYITHDYEFGPFDHTLEGSVFELGETTVVWTVTDAAGNAVSCTLIVEVLDTEAPQFTNCPRPDIILNPLPGTCEAFSNFSLPLATDNCDGLTVTQTDMTGLTTGEMFPVGTTILTFEASDVAGNTDQCEMRIIVNDSHAVLATGDGCPDDVDLNTDPGDCGAIINNIAPAFMDSNCPDNLAIIYRIDEVGGDEVSNGFTDASGEFLGIGDYTAQYRAQDQPLLLISEITHNIQAPLGGNDIIPAYMTARALPDEDFLEITNFGPASLDIGGLDIERIHATGRDTFRVPALEILAPGEVFVLHFGHDYDSPADHYYNVHCAPNLAATDGAAYILSHSGRVLDVAAINGFDPIGTGVAGVPTASDWTGSVSDSNAGIRRISVWDDNAANDFVPAFVCGEITIGMFNPDLSFMADNGSLTSLQARLPNKLECSFAISINDNELPVCGSYEPYDDYLFNTATTINAGDCFEATLDVPGDYLLADVNTALQAAAGDMANLTVTLISPAGMALILSDGICAGSNGWDLTYDSDSIMRPFVQTACAQLTSGEVLRPVNDLNLFNKRPAQGIWTLQIAHNATENNDPVSFTSWELRLSELIPYQQGDTTIENDFRVCGADFTWLHTGIWDNCPGGELTITYTFEDGTIQGTAPITRQEYGLPITRFFDVGVTTVTYDMTDSNGNASSCAFDLTVLDTEPPQLFCPSDTTLYLAGRECEIVYIPTDWSTIDNCAVTDTIVSPPWHLPLPIGVNVVTLTVLDEAGNPTVCEYEVTVVEFVPDQPDMACIQDLNVSLGSDCLAEITADMVLFGDNYHCIEDYVVTLYEGPNPDDPLISTSPLVTEAYAGQTIVYSVYDPDFDITCWGYIHVELYDEPDFECPANIAVNCLSDTSPATTGEPVLLSCALGGATVTHEDVVQEFGACDDPRVLITRTWTVADGFGNSSTCVQTITIEAFDVADIVFPPDYNNITLPALNCADVFNDSTLTHPDSTGYPTLNGTTDVYLPNYCNASYFYEDQTFNTCPGSYEIVRIWQVRNTCLPYEFGINPRIHTQIIQVFDTDGPQVVCPPAEVISTGPFDCTATYQIPDPTVEDACSSTTYSVTTNNGVLSVVGSTYYLSNLPVGSTTIEYRVVDECVGVNNCSYTITVEDLIEPTASCDDGLNISIGGGDVANGILGEARIYAADINEGSNDNCGDVSLEVRRNYWRDGTCDDSASRWSEWGEYIDFYCCDLAKEITIELRVTDENDNVNTCWMVITPEDKLVPYCYAPDPVTLTCTELPLTFPGSIEEAYNADPEGTSAMMDELFGAASGTDNCAVDVLIEQSPIININECGWGSITRRFEAWQWRPEGDVNGNGQLDAEEAWRSINACNQLITITELHDFTLDFPEDADADCGDPDVATIITETVGCDVLSVNISEPIQYAATGDECYKLSIVYDVINWCLWDGEYTGYVIARMTEDDGESLAVDRAVEGNERPVVTYTTAGGLCIDRRHSDRDGDSSLSNCDTPTLPNYGRYIYAQFIKVYDSTAPVVTVGEYGGPTDECPDLEAGQFGDYTGSCDAEVTIPFSVSDECELFDGDGNLVVSIVLAEIDEFAVDANGDGSIKANEFVSDGSIVGNITDNGDGTYIFSGNYDIITSAMGPNVVHAIRIQFEDGCGNQVSEYIEFDVVDCKGPAPICINGLTVTLMPTGEGSCAMAIWAADFEGSPIYDCTGQGPELDSDTGNPRVTKYAIYRAADVEAAGDDFVPDPADTGLVLTDEDEETTIVHIYAFDEEGNYDYCETYVLVQLHATCNPGGGGSIAGIIATESNEMVEGVEVNLNGEMSMTMVTDTDGAYHFDELNIGFDYSVTPYLNANPLNGVSTFDIILISKHILGIQPLDSPYKRIAADVNRSNTITTLDLIQIRKLILNINTDFANNTSWRFVESAYDFPDPTNPWFEIFPELVNENNLTIDITNADFIGVKIGDVNGSVQANALSGEDRTLQGQFNFWLEDIPLLAGNEYTVAVYGHELADWEGFQGTIEWQGVSLLDIDYGLANSENIGLRYLNEGILTTSWNQSVGEANDASLPLFSCRIIAHTDQALSQAVSISDRYTQAEAYPATEATSPARVGLLFGSQSPFPNERFELYQNIPNPFAQKTLIAFYLPTDAEVTLDVRDVSGRLLHLQQTKLEAGYHSLPLNRSQLQGASGVLSYTLKADQFTATKKMVLIGE